MQKSLGGDSKKHRRKRKDQAGGAPANAPTAPAAPMHKSDSSSSGSDSSDSSSSSSGSDSESDHEGGPAGGPTGVPGGGGKHLKTPANAPAMANNMSNSNAASVLKVRNDLMPQTAAAAGGIPVNNANPHFGNGVGGPAPVAGKVFPLFLAYPTFVKRSHTFVPLRVFVVMQLT